MSPDQEKVRQAIFSETGIQVGEKDPLMAGYVLNKILLAEMNTNQEVMLEQLKSELEGIAFQWGNDAKDKAERILNASLTASKTAMSDLLRAGIQEATAQIRTELQQSERKTEQYANSIRTWSIVGMLGSTLTLLAALAVTWAALG